MYSLAELCERSARPMSAGGAVLTAGSARNDPSTPECRLAGRIKIESTARQAVDRLPGCVSHQPGPLRRSTSSITRQTENVQNCQIAAKQAGPQLKSRSITDGATAKLQPPTRHFTEIDESKIRRARHPTRPSKELPGLCHGTALPSRLATGLPFSFIWRRFDRVRN